MQASGLAVEQSAVGGVAAGEVWSLQLLCSEQVGAKEGEWSLRE